MRNRLKEGVVESVNMYGGRGVVRIGHERIIFYVSRGRKMVSSPEGVMFGEEGMKIPHPGQHLICEWPERGLIRCWDFLENYLVVQDAQRNTIQAAHVI